MREIPMGQYSHKSKSEVWRERFQKKVVLIRMVSHHIGFTSTVMTCFQNAQLEHGSQLWQTVAAAADITHDPTVQNLHWPPAETTPADTTIRRWSHWKGEHLGGGQLDYKMWTMWLVSPTSGLHLGWFEVLRSLRHYLQAQGQGHHTIDVWRREV